jgi:hypothetical protein
MVLGTITKRDQCWYFHSVLRPIKTENPIKIQTESLAQAKTQAEIAFLAVFAEALAAQNLVRTMWHQGNPRFQDDVEEMLKAYGLPGWSG